MRCKRAGSYAVFERRYQPVERADGSLWREWDDAEVLAAFERGREGHRLVWTVVSGDSGGEYLVPGFATVNYLCRVLCAKPWPDEEEAATGYVW